MKDLIFVCAGGFFRELIEYISYDIESQELKNINVKGFLDDDLSIEYDNNINNLGTIKDYDVMPDDVFIITAGSCVVREEIYSDLKVRGANLFTYIHSSARISPSARIGQGCIVCPFTIINANAELANNVVINVHASIGHEASVGEHCVLSPYSAMNGGARLGRMSFMGSRATVFPMVNVGEKCIVDTHSYVKANAEDKSIISLRSEYKVIKNRLI